MRFVVGSLSEFPPGTRKIVRVGGREIGVFRFGDEFYAVRNRCPHQGGPLCEGFVVARTASSEPGVIDVLDAPPLVVCPWHAWQYDARTGQAWAPGDPGARAYPVSVEHGAALAERRENGEVQFVAETFPVYVDDDYVILDA
jgi:nitrite reductase/ring-hydroxylating ferredoxin subunit